VGNWTSALSSTKLLILSCVNLIGRFTGGSHTTDLGRVIFSASRREIAGLDVRLGPCATGPAAGSPRIASLWRQRRDPVESVAALFHELVPGGGSPWQATSTEPPGTLFSLADEFVIALAALQAASIQPSPTEPWVDQDHPSMAPYRAAARGWLAASRWPSGTGVDALVGRLLRDVEAAVVAQRRQQGLYMWSGPVVLDGMEDGLTGRQILAKSGY
jgi:hypothetical protein